MAYGFAFVVIAFGGSLFYKGYKGYSWPQFYAAVLGGGGASTNGATKTRADAKNTPNKSPALTEVAKTFGLGKG